MVCQEPPYSNREFQAKEEVVGFSRLFGTRTLGRLTNIGTTLLCSSRRVKKQRQV